MTKETCFIFKSCSYEPERRALYLDYAYGSGQCFTEAISFPGAKTKFSDEEQEALSKLAGALHLAAGISYYKAFCPAEIIIENQKLSQPEADFFYKFYLLGLGEFAATNDLDLRDVINFPVSTAKAPAPSPLALCKMAVVPIGGGKDSLVSLEILKQEILKKTQREPGRVFRPIAINAGPPILEVIAQTKSQSKSRAESAQAILITRKIDPELFKLNDMGAYNGHVPITGILSFIMAFAAILYGYDTVVMSNEQSANEGNMVRHGLSINHQYSKSLEFELDFSHFIHDYILRDFTYFSLLRPLSETGIAALFARAPKYFQSFKSCNRNFHIAEGNRKYGWCCDCPKCRFVYLALAPFIGKQGMIQIFGTDMLNDLKQADGYQELLGLMGHKPFECVGEIDECRLLLKSLALMPEWQDNSLIKKFGPLIDVPGLSLADLTAQSLAKHAGHNLPDDYKRMLDDFIGS